MTNTSDHYRALFETCQTPLLDLDIRALRDELARLHGSGVACLRSYLAERPLTVGELVKLIRVNDVNNAALRLWGADSRDEFERRLNETVLQEAVSVIIDAFCAIHDGKKSFESYVRLCAFDRHQFEAVLSFPVPDSDEGFRNVPVGVTEYHGNEQREAQLRESERRFRAILDQTFQFIGLLTPDGVLIDANRSALDAGGVVPSQVLGKLFWETVWWSHSEALQAQLKDAIARAAKGEFIRFEATHTLPDGSLIDVDFSLKPVFDETGAVELLIPEGRDVSERREIMAAEAAREAAELSNTMKSQFLAEMSHELRTPLNAILGFSELVLGQHVGPFEADRYLAYVKDIHQSGRHMLELINNILDISAIEAGERKVEFALVDLKDLLAECLRNSRPLADDEGVALNFEAADDDFVVSTDRNAFMQIILNLLSNAIKYTETGGTVTLSLQEHDGAARILVKDDGIGISPDLLPHVTEPFRQGNSNPYESKSGIGLGLSIVKSLADILDADFRIESDVGMGTTAIIELPVSQKAGKESPAVASAK
jgi:PAS domain S-box-containing protein